MFNALITMSFIFYMAEVGPKKILDLMNVPRLTRENVASHLQVRTPFWEAKFYLMGIVQKNYLV